MRTATAIIAILLGATWHLTRIDVASPLEQVPIAASAWRRTLSGWERADSWPTAAASRRSLSRTTTLHPGVVALLELLCANLCLVAGHSAKAISRRSRPGKDL
jgi:hypothetical protein